MTFDRIREAALMISHFFDSVRMDGLFGEGQSAPDNPETDRTMTLPVGEGTPSFQTRFHRLDLNECARWRSSRGCPSATSRGWR